MRTKKRGRWSDRPEDNSPHNERQFFGAQIITDLELEQALSKDTAECISFTDTTPEVVLLKPGDSKLWDELGDEKFFELVRARPILTELRERFLASGKNYVILCSAEASYAQWGTSEPSQILRKLYALLPGAVLLPIPKGTKAPKGIDALGWQKITYEQTQEPDYQARLLAAIARGGNIGIRLGTRNLHTIDIDVPETGEWFRRANPFVASTLVSHGSKRGFQVWFYCKNGPNGQAVYRLEDSDGQEYGEFRCGGCGAGAQSVLLGVHPSGSLYEIENLVTPKLVDFNEIQWPGPAPAEKAPERDWLAPQRVEDLKPDLPPQILKGALYRGCRFVIGGGPKSKKSWLLMQFCYCVANGLPFLGIPTSWGRTLYINFELLEGDCRQRFVKIRDAIGQGDLSNVLVMQLRGRARLLTDDQLKRMIWNEYAAVCLDPIYKLMAGRDERLGVDVAPLLEMLEAIGEEQGCSIGFCQHFAKGNQANKFAIDRISGSNYFARDADVIFTLTDLSDKDCFALEITQRSFAEIPVFGVRFEHPLFVRDASLDVSDIRQPGKDKKTDPIIERMLAALQAADYEKGGLTTTEWHRAIQIEGRDGKPTPSWATFKRRLEKLKKMGDSPILKSVATGKWMLSPAYATRRAAFTEESSPNGSNDE